MSYACASISATMAQGGITKPMEDKDLGLQDAQTRDERDETGEVNATRDGKRIRAMARELSLKCRQVIFYEAQELDVPTIKYKYQYLLEEVIADMESFV